MANQGDFSSGDVLSAADLNGFSQVTIASGAQSIPTATNTTLSFDTEVIDVGGWFAPTSSDITPDIDGIYIISISVVGMNPGPATRTLGMIYQNATVIASYDNNSSVNDFTITAYADVTDGDDFAVVVYQNGGSTETPTATFSVHLIRAT